MLNLTSKDKRNILIQGIDNGNYPEVLYKYRTIEQIKKILENFSFWFATPDSFNDPFDCALSEVKDYDLQDVRKHFQNLGTEDKHIARFIELCKKDSGLLKKQSDEVREKTILSKGVLSLSKTNKNILMWSHYSDSHKGVAVELELKKDIDFFLMPISVDYQENYEPLNYFNDPHSATINTLKIKSKQWKYEEEVRVYKNIHGLHKVSPEAIKSIYFGISSNETDINDIKTICNNENLKHIKFYKAEKSFGAFDIEFSCV